MEALYGDVCAETDIESVRLRASMFGDSTDLFEMANRMYRGIGVSQDKRRALEYYKRAADKGHAKAQWNLATLYQLGEGRPCQVFGASWYFGLAAKSGITSPPDAPKPRPKSTKASRAPRRRVMTSEKQALALRFEHRCATCRELLQPGWHADHVVALADGGPDETANMQPLCSPCHTLKTAGENSARKKAHA